MLLWGLCGIVSQYALARLLCRRTVGTSPDCCDMGCKRVLVKESNCKWKAGLLIRQKKR